MAPFHLCGFESGTQEGGGLLATSGATLDATVSHSGTYSLKSIFGGSGSAAFFEQPAGDQTGSGAAPRAGYLSVRFYMRSTGVGSDNPIIVQGGTIGAGDGAGQPVQLVLASGNQLILEPHNTVFPTSTNTFPTDGLWHLVEMSSGSSGTTVYVDGVAWVTDTNNVSVTAATTAIVGSPLSTAAGFWIDDIVWDNATITPQGDYSLYLHKAISDNARVNWTAGAGGTTSLWSAVSSVPAAGLGDPSATNTSQIKDAAKSSTDNYDANVASYTTLGMTAGGTVRGVQAVARASVSAGGTSCAGAVVIVSNPSGQTEQAFFYSNTVGTADDGTSASGWVCYYGPCTVPGALTLGTSPVVRVGKRTATSKVNSDVDFLGMYSYYSVPYYPLDRFDTRRRGKSPIHRATW